MTDEDVKSGWSKYKELVEVAMREKAQAQVVESENKHAIVNYLVHFRNTWFYCLPAT